MSRGSGRIPPALISLPKGRSKGMRATPAISRKRRTRATFLKKSISWTQGRINRAKAQTYSGDASLIVMKGGMLRWVRGVNFICPYPKLCWISFSNTELSNSASLENVDILGRNRAALIEGDVKVTGVRLRHSVRHIRCRISGERLGIRLESCGCDDAPLGYRCNAEVFPSD